MNRAASKNNDKRCGTCAQAEWQRTPAGNVRRSVPGRCLVPFTMPALPYCIVVNQPHRVAVWHDTGAKCPTWEPKP